MDIGTLTGQIALEDQISGELTIIASKVVRFAEQSTGAFGDAAIAVGIFTAAIGGAITSIVALGEKGSTINGVTEAYDRMASQAGTTGDILRGNLSEGVKGTVDSMELMQTTSRLLTSGMKLTGDQALLMGQAAREMAAATGGTATQALGTLSSALTTGRTRGLAMAGIQVDLKKAQEDFAASIGATAKELNAEGVLESKRIAIFDALEAKVAKMGISEVNFKERIEQAQVALEEWGGKLASSVAASPHVMAALDAIGKAIEQNFGGAGQSAIQVLMGWINAFADTVARYAPTVIGWVANIKDGIIRLWQDTAPLREGIGAVFSWLADAAMQYGPVVGEALNRIKDGVIAIYESTMETWDALPDWFKQVAINAGLAGAAVAVASSYWTEWLSVLANVAQIWGTYAGYLTPVIAGISELYGMIMAFGWEGFLVTITGWGEALLAAASAVAWPIAALAALVASIYLVYKYWDELVAITTLTWDTIKRVINDVLDSAIMRFIIAWDTLLLKIAGWAVVGVAMLAFELLKDTFIILKGIIMEVVEWVEKLWNAFTGDSVVQGAIAGITSGFKILEGVVKTVFDYLVGAIAKVMKGVEWLNDHLPSPLQFGQKPGALPTPVNPALANEKQGPEQYKYGDLPINYVTTPKALVMAPTAPTADVSRIRIGGGIADAGQSFSGGGEVAGVRDSTGFLNTDKVKAAAEKSAETVRAILEKTQGYYEDFGTNVDKMQGETLQAQLSGLAKWDTAQQSSIEKQLAAERKAHTDTVAVVKATTDQLWALNADYASKRLALFAKSDAEAQASVAKGFAGQANVMTQLAQSTSTWEAQVDASWDGVGDSADHMVMVMTSGIQLVGHELKNLPPLTKPVGDEWSRVQKIIEDGNEKSLESFVPLNAAQLDQVTQLQKLGMTQEQVANTMQRDISLIPPKIGQASTALADLAGAFERLGQASGGGLGSVLSGAGQIFSFANSAQKATQAIGQNNKEIGGSFGYLSVLSSSNANNSQKMAAGAAAVANTVQGISSMQSALDKKGTGERLMGSAAAGAQIGSIAGPYGAAVGAAAGFVVGLIKGKPDWAKAQDEMAKGYGVAVSDELSHAIADTAKTEFKGDRNTAALASMKEIIAGAGGLTSTNLPLLEARFHDVFSAIQTGHMSLAQGTKVLDENFGEFAKAGTDAYGLLDKNLREVIKLNGEFGTDSKAVLEYVGQQGAIVAQQLGTSLQIGAQALEQGNAGLADAVTVKTQQTADAMAYSIDASFNAMLASGMSFGEAVKAIQPAIDGLAVQMEAAGLTGSEAFQTLQGEVALYADAVAGPALQSVESLSAGMVALDNMGKMNQDTFLALSGQIGQTYSSLVAQGKDGTQVMFAMRDSLQRVWEEQQEFGFKTDDTTQKLIDQAVQEGIVGERHKSASDQMLDATKHMATALDGIAKALGATLPDAAETGAKSIQGSLNKIKAPSLTVKVDYDTTGAPGGVKAATGGVVYASHGGVLYADFGNPFVPQGTDTVPAMLTPGERVLSVNQNRAYENNFTQQGPSNQEVVDSINGLRSDLNAKLPRALARALHTGLAGLRTAS